MRKIIVAIPLVLSLMACGNQAQDFDATGTFEATEVTVSAQLADQINNAQIVAPRAGTVLEKYAEAGEFVTPGRPLLKLANVDEMYLRAYVTSLQLKHCRVGQTVMVMADYGEGKQKRTYRGVVAWISSRAEFTPKTILTDDERADLVYAVKIKFKNDGYAKIGMYGEVKFND